MKDWYNLAPHIFRQTSVVFMGTSPAPELANDFAFWHEFEFLSHMVNNISRLDLVDINFEFINQFSSINIK